MTLTDAGPLIALIDLADASLVALAEASGVKKVFTLDTDFYIYRIHSKDSFDVTP